MGTHYTSVRGPVYDLKKDELDYVVRREGDGCDRCASNASGRGTVAELYKGRSRAWKVIGVTRPPYMLRMESSRQLSD